VDAPAAGSSAEREWWLRALAVFQAPRTLFASLRSESDEQASARQEPVLALVILTGVAGVLLTPEAGRLLDDPLVDESLAVVAVLVFLTGLIYGAATYWLGGAALYVGLRGAGSRGSYRRARHVLVFAAAPLVLTLLLVWPFRLALHGGDAFRSGGDDGGAAGSALDALSALFVVWALGLLLYGIAVVERWTVVRAAVALALVLLGLLVLTLPLVIPLSSR
jgi:hypothetical protein